MGLALLGLGTASPGHSIAQQDAAMLAQAFCSPSEEQARLLLLLYERTRVRRRGSVLLETADGKLPRQSFFPPAPDARGSPTTRQRMERYVREAVPLAVEACRKGLTEAGADPSEIEQLITVTCTGFAAPGVDVALIKQLGLAPTVSRTQIGFMGCHGAFNGLKVASACLDAAPASRALLCAVELCSLHFRYGWNPGQIVANALFADGAAAVVAGSAAAGRPREWQMTAAGSCLFPDSEEAMTWSIGDHGFEMDLSARVPALIGAHLRPWFDGWLERLGLARRQIRSWAIHPGGPRILSSVAASLDLSDAQTAPSREVLAEHGNMSSPTILFILDRLHRQGASGPCVALGFGPGLAVEAALFLLP